MSSIQQYLKDDHRKCDELFADMEKSVNSKDKYFQFKKSMEHHFCMEEEILFPAMVKVTGSEMGPISVMKMEHEQMRNLFQRMDASIESDPDDFLGLSETLIILIQQHNSKEEMVLYPMAENLLENSAEEILKTFESGPCRKD